MDRVVAENGAPVMLSLLRATRIFVALEPVDMRQNFNGLYARVQSVLQQDPLSGHFFVFTNRSRTRLRLLIWDGSGLWVCTKRLDVVGALRQIFMDSARTPLLSVETMEDVMWASVAQQRFNMLLLSAFGLIALALGGAGLYGVMSYTVARQTKEIGVRMALGAQRSQILKMVPREASLLVVAVSARARRE